MPVKDRQGGELYDYPVLVQTTGIRFFQCACGQQSKFRVRPQSHRVKCSKCKRVFVIGSIVYDVTSEVYPRPPMDLIIPVKAQPARERVDSTEFGRCIEPVLHGGTWRSGEPASVQMPESLNELWALRANEGELWIAASVAFGTRYVVAPMSNPEARIVISSVDWKRQAVRIDV